MKLGKRLEQLKSMVTSQYDHIWDCCCDHGLLGAALLAQKSAPHIHFVDVVPELMQQLKDKLACFFSDSPSQWHLHCMDVTKLPLQDYKAKHLVIIAGVGGDLMTEFVQAIYQNNPTADIDFLLCPVHHQYRLRQQLIQYQFRLLSESLVVENERHYEILWVSSAHNPHANINPVGDAIWQADTPEKVDIAKTYLRKTLAHYQRMQLGKHAGVESIIDAYRAVQIKSPKNF